MSLPDQPRAGILPPARALAATAVDFTRRLTWRTLHPRDREAFLPRPKPAPLTRLDVHTADGWVVPLFRLDPRPGGHGTPVLLASALGFGADAHRCGEHALAGQLQRAGYTVYLFSHRGDRASRGHGRSDFDAMLEGDVPAALVRVLSDASAHAVHWVGHGLGGQLGLVAASRGEPIASLVAVDAPVRFDRSAPTHRRLARAARLLPSGLMVPADHLARLALPFVETQNSAHRELLEYGTERVSADLLRQVLAWQEHGSLVSRGGIVDYGAVLRAEIPLLVAYTKHDPCVLDVLQRWRHPDTMALRLPADEARVAVGEGLGPVVDWLDDRQERAWPLAVDASTA